MLFADWQCYSRHNNRFVMSLKSLLMSIIILIGLTIADCNRPGNRGSNKHHKEPVTRSLRPILSSPEECLRTCRTDEPPKTCYWHLTLELYPVLGEACDYCQTNWTNSISSNCQCVSANGVERVMLAVNRMLPGPSIQVCQGDKLVIDVDNQMEGMETSIHWHGVYQNGSQYYDGVPQLTQCAIPQGTTFRYQFIAGNEGTHFWHAHIGLQKMDGIYGSLIVREPQSEDPNGDTYDRDEHVIVMSDWMNLQATERFPGTRYIRPGQDPDSILINGKGQYTDPVSGNVTTSPSEEFVVEQGYRYKFRIINAFCTVCPALINIEGHTMQVIATDGIAVKPRTVSSIVSLTGERWDVIINANRTKGSYWIHVRGLGECSTNRIQQTAVLRYKGITSGPSTPEPAYDEPYPSGLLLNPLDGNCTFERTDALCVNHLRSARPVEKDILIRDPDVIIPVPFRFYQYSVNELYRPNTYSPFLVTPAGLPFVATVENITFQFPRSPPLSQIKDIPPNTFCNKYNRPVDCGPTCRCTNVVDIPLNAIVEIRLFDKMGFPTLTHPFHLHGQSFYITGMGLCPSSDGTNTTSTNICDADSKDMFPRNMKNPPAKDTVAVPTNGYVIARFRATNPGYWLLHCHFIYHIVDGMEMVFRVGTPEDLPPVPKGFPTCGDWSPPITPLEY